MCSKTSAKPIKGLLQLCLRNRIKVIAGFLASASCRSVFAPYLGQDFFPDC